MTRSKHHHLLQRFGAGNIFGVLQLPLKPVLTRNVSFLWAL